MILELSHECKLIIVQSTKLQFDNLHETVIDAQMNLSF